MIQALRVARGSNHALRTHRPRMDRHQAYATQQAAGVPRVNDRRVLNGIFWVLRSGAPWRDLPGAFGPYTTCYNRFVRWRRAGVWSRIIDAFAAAHDAAVQMIDTSNGCSKQEHGSAPCSTARARGRGEGE
jgi:transposase